MDPEELKEFSCDCKQIEWVKYINNFVRGTSIWVLNENQVAPELNFKQIIIKNKSLFDNFNESMQHRKSIVPKSSD